MFVILDRLLQVVTFNNQNLKQVYTYYVIDHINISQHLNYYKQCIDSDK